MNALLDSRDPAIRRAAVYTLAEQLSRGGDDLLFLPKPERDVNNHIHTTYSFSPYTPSRAVWEARRAGLATAGIMDHDTISGAREFLEAGRVLGLPVTVGAELRVSFSDTPLEGRRINHPDQKSAAYLAFHGVPTTQIDALDAWLVPVRAERERRNRQMLSRLNSLTEPIGGSLDYDRDVRPMSDAEQGGTVTERHLLFVLATRLTAILPDCTTLLEPLAQHLNIHPDDRTKAALLDPDNPHVLYDLVGWFKKDLLPRVYIPACSELIPVRDAVAFADYHGIIAAYPYLGDVGESITGDKSTQRFEDGYLEELLDVLTELGIRAITYMPSRNTPEQLSRLQNLCRRRGLFEISGEDINQPRQSFVCETMRQPAYAHLYDAAWALIGHERRVAEHPASGLFSEESCRKTPDITKRVAEYSRFARCHAR